MSEPTTEDSALEHVVDPELKAESDAKLKAAGLLDDEAGVPETEEVDLHVPAEEEGETATPELEVEEQEDSPAEPEVVPEPEPETYLGGKYGSKEAFEKGYGELEAEFTRKSQESQQLSEAANILGQLMKTEDGMRAIQSVINPQPEQPEITIPTDADGYNKFIEERGLYGGIDAHADMVAQRRMAPVNQELQQVKQTLNSILGMFEQQAITQKYGDLTELKPHLDQVEKDFKDIAPYLPMEAKIRMAKGYINEANAPPVETPKPKVPIKEPTKEKHRLKVLESSAESASIASPEARVIDGSKLSAAEFEKQFKLKRVIRD